MQKMKNKINKGKWKFKLENKEILQNLEKIIPKEKIKINEPMKEHTSFKIGGPAEFFVKISTIVELKKILEFSNSNNIPLTIVGNGSNLLVLDKGIKGIVIKLDLKEIEIKSSNDDIEVIVDSGVPLGLLAQKLLQQEIEGFEELSGIPGTIGRSNYYECRSTWKRNERHYYRSSSNRL